MSSSMRQALTVRHASAAFLAIPILLLIGVLYWPIHGAGFVWDDKTCLHDNPGLWAGGNWLNVAFHGFAEWKSYFRPLGVALLLAEARGFALAPGPMHVLSLVLHLSNTLLVGVLALRLQPRGAAPSQRKALASAAILIYGLHPALIETVSWISSQFDLLLTLLMLLGLLANVCVQRLALRAGLVGGCFFLAACTKETAVAFPVLLALVDWLGTDGGDAAAPADSNRKLQLASIVRRQWPVYAAVLMAGIAYLVFRRWALAGMVASAAYQPFVTWQRFQTVCFTYVVYWRMIIWPFICLSPEHIVPAARFAVTSPMSILMDLAAPAISVLGLALALKRRSLGILIVGVTTVLSPVLHVIPIGFDESLYHERYAAPAIAFACMLLPGVCATAVARARQVRFVVLGSTAALVPWLLLAALNIHVTVPLWADDIALWQWAVKQNPDDPGVQNHLLAAYVDANDWVRAAGVADSLMTTGESCPACMLNVASFALARKDVPRATAALRKANDAFANVVPTPTLLIAYVLATGNLHQLNHDDAGAEEAYRAAISLDPKRHEGYMYLALLQARRGETTKARAMLDKALELSARGDHPQLRAHFDAALTPGRPQDSKQ